MVYCCVNYLFRRLNILVYNCYFYRKRYKLVVILYEWCIVFDYLLDEFNYGNNNKFFEGWELILKIYDRYVYVYVFYVMKILMRND